MYEPVPRCNGNGNICPRIHVRSSVDGKPVTCLRLVLHGTRPKISQHWHNHQRLFDGWLGVNQPDLVTQGCVRSLIILNRVTTTTTLSQPCSPFSEAHSKMTKCLGSTSIRHRLDATMSDRGRSKCFWLSGIYNTIDKWVYLILTTSRWNISKHVNVDMTAPQESTASSSWAIFLS